VNPLAQWQVAQDRTERRRWACSALTIALGYALLTLAWHRRPASAPLASSPALPMIVELAPLPQAPSEPRAQPPGRSSRDAPPPQLRPMPPPRPRVEPAVIDTPAPVAPAEAAGITLPDAGPPEPPDATPPEPLDISPLPPDPGPPVPEPPSQTLASASAASAPPAEEAPASTQAVAPQQAARALAIQAAQLNFREHLLGHLQRHKRYPPSAQSRRQQGVSYVRFTMDRAGRVLASTLERASRHAVLDAEALALLQRAQPLPPLPDEIDGDTLEIVVPIEFFLRQ
jgi:protein TonB